MFDDGLLSPVTRGRDELVADRAFAAALVGAEIALVQAYGDVGLAPREAVAALAREFGLDDDSGTVGVDPAPLADAAVAGGNPVIPLVSEMRDRMPREHRSWVHRGATSQDILDTAIMIVARRAVVQVRASLVETSAQLMRCAAVHQDDLSPARTLTQHAVPTTIGWRLMTWSQGLDRAVARLDGCELPSQLGGAGGTRASFIEITGSPERAEKLAAAFAARSGAHAPARPWHVTRGPVTELGDALTASLDSMGKIAADVATLSRTEIGEVAEGTGGGSSAMPQKRNPAEAVLIRSAALRAPNLAATLHLSSALAVDERPDGAWHAEWPVLRELMRLALGASWHTAHLVENLQIDVEQSAKNLSMTDGLVLAERLSIVLAPVIGAEEVSRIVAAVVGGADVHALVQDALSQHGSGSEIDVDDLLNPRAYTGLAGHQTGRKTSTRPDSDLGHEGETR